MLNRSLNNYVVGFVLFKYIIFKYIYIMCVLYLNIIISKMIKLLYS